MTDASGTTNYTYDGADRLSVKATPEGTINYFREFNTERLSEIRSANGNGMDNRFVYDADGRLSQVIANSDSASINSLTTTYGYDPAGNLQSFSYPNGVSHGYTYDALNRLTNLSVSCGSGAPACGPGGGNNAFSYAYTLGAAGNRTKVTELSGRTVQYGYDDLYRLTSETIANATSQNGTIGYTYDAVGNRQQITSTVNAIPTSGTLLYDANDRTATDTYDNNGNTVAQAGITNVYDFENHLVQHGAMTIAYDGDGNRVAETVGGVTTKYLVDSNTLTGYAQVRAEFQNGTRVRAYMYGLERLAEVQTLNNTPNTVSYYGYDGHGSVRNLTNASSLVTDTYDYDAFGNLVASTGSTPNNYLFAGEQFDPNLGLYYNRARYLDVRSGRFWGIDTFEGRIDDPQSLHKYAFTENNPLDRVDASGHDDADLASNLISVSTQFVIAAITVTTAVTACAEGYKIYGGSGLCGSTPMKEFYRGTSGYDAEEVVTAQAIDPARLIERQSEYTPDFGIGVYMTPSYVTAEYFAGLFYGTGRSGGPAILDIKLPEADWKTLLSKGALENQPIKHLDFGSQAFVPLQLVPEFNLYARFSQVFEY